jgi:hypothetical protein
MKYLLLIVSILLYINTNHASANTNSALSDIETIYWLNGPQHQDAIVYARFVNFDNLVNLISTAAIPNNIVAPSQCKKSTPTDRLMLLKQQESEYLYLMDDCIRYQNKFYKTDPQLISKYRTINIARINRNELAGHRVVKLALEKNKPVSTH